MTTIAWDGKTLAVDSGHTLGDTMLPGTCTKIVEIYGSWIAYTGEAQDGYAFIEWFRMCCPETDRPKLHESFAALVLRPGKLTRYENKCIPMDVESPFYASGSGREYALAALHLGYSAEVAVEVACEFDVWSKGPVQSSNQAPTTPGPKRRGNDARRTAMKKQKGKMPPNKPGKKGC